jgi:hypothetical protein
MQCMRKSIKALLFVLRRACRHITEYHSQQEYRLLAIPGTISPLLDTTPIHLCTILHGLLLTLKYKPAATSGGKGGGLASAMSAQASHLWRSACYRP